MSKKIFIYEETETINELIDTLRDIVTLLEDGFTSGNYPGWEIVDEED